MAASLPEQNYGSTASSTAEDATRIPTPPPSQNYGSIASSTAEDATRIPTPPPSSLTGISALGFDAVIAAAGGRAALSGMTTEQLKRVLVLPATRHLAAPYSELLLAERGAAAVGPATAFLSHAYDYKFLDAVDAVVAWGAHNPRPDGMQHFFYFDLLVVNQHSQTLIVPFETLRDEFGKGVRSVGVTLFLLDFAAPLSLGRAWCVFEAATALVSGARFEVIMPPRDQAAFADALVTDFASLASKTCTVDVERARAREREDEENIRAAVTAMGGFARVNQLVIGAMREWMAGSGRAALAALHPLARETAGLAPALAALLLEQGRLDASEQLYRVVVGGLRAASLRATVGLAEVLWSRGRLAEAEPLLREALPELRAGGAPAARDALRASNLLAVVLFERGDMCEAGKLYRETLVGRREVLGASHPDTLISTNNMGFFMRSQGHLGDAEALYREALEGRRAALGPCHKDTLGSLNGLAVTLRAAGRCGEAEPLFREALSARARTLGDAHASTVRSVANLGILLHEMGRIVEARPLYERALEGFAAALGGAHADTLGAMLNLAVVEWEADERAAALERAREAAAGFAQALGREHPDTTLARENVVAMEAAAAGGEAARKLPALQQRAPR